MERIQNVTAPVDLHVLDKNLRAGIEEVVRKVVCRATFEGVGRDLFLRVYLAGLYHGSQSRAMIEKEGE